MADEKQTVPTWGYRPGEAQLFHLAPGAGLPDGWVDTPQPAPAVEAEAPPVAKRKARSE